MVTVVSSEDDAYSEINNSIIATSGTLRQRGHASERDVITTRSSRVRAIDFRAPSTVPANILIKGDSSGYNSRATSAVLDTPQRDLRAAVHRQTPGRRTISMFWTEKLKIILDACQILGVIWASKSAWPENFWAATQFAPALAGDVLSVIEYNALTSSSHSLPHNWSAMTTSFAALALAGWCLLPLAISCLRWCCRCACCGTRCSTSPQDATTKTLCIEECIYLPVCLALLHLLTCRADVPLHSWSFPADAVACWCWWSSKAADGSGIIDIASSPWYGWVLLVLTVLACLIAVEFLLRIPRVLRTHANEVHIYSDAKQHERYLCAKELEYMLYINTDYEDEHFQTVASFRRHAIHQRERVVKLKIVVCMIAVVFPAVSFGGWTMASHACVLLFWAIVQTLAAPYRCRST